MANLLYGSGMRLMEAMRLRVKDVDFNEKQIIVREGKGNNLVTLLPEKIIVPLQQHLERVNAIHEMNIREGYGRVYLPHALARKYLTQTGNSAGSISFLHKSALLIPEAARYKDTTYRKRYYRRP
jgi:integrase